MVRRGAVQRLLRLDHRGHRREHDRAAGQPEVGRVRHLAESMWATVIVLVAMAIGTATMLRNRDVAYGLVLIWAFVGILIRQTSAAELDSRYPAIIAAVVASLVIFVGAEAAGPAASSDAQRLTAGRGRRGTQGPEPDIHVGVGNDCCCLPGMADTIAGFQALGVIMGVRHTSVRMAAAASLCVGALLTVSAPALAAAWRRRHHTSGGAEDRSCGAEGRRHDRETRLGPAGIAR